ncbi:MAG: hypothetical protein JNM18_15735 [Planctomycetaceae bacterium]|nr:hypothetical protein [Planctomycetaceae bacterium]
MSSPVLPPARITLQSILIAMIWFSAYFALTGFVFRHMPAGRLQWLVLLPCNPVSGAIFGGGVGALFHRYIEGSLGGLLLGGLSGLTIALLPWVL